MKIFISSTVHDLKDLRRLLRDEFKRCGFDPVLSEIGDIGIEPNQHSYDTCIKQAESCDVVVGVIDSRAGGIVREGVYKGKTITQAEMEAALAKGRLVYVFARGAITDAEPVYKKYMGGSEPIAFRPTDNVVASEEVLTFIDSWRKKAKDNWITPFQDPRDIVRHVLRQLERAGKHQGVLILHDLDQAQYRLISQLQTVATSLNSLACETNLDSSQGSVRSGMFQVFNEIVQRRLEHCTTELAKLCGGSVEVSGTDCVDKTKDCFSAASISVLATSFPDHRIWDHGEGSDYLDCNRKALQSPIGYDAVPARTAPF
jgi:hypothetical protein